jgi:uncharacterized caspase-like protein
MVVVLRALLVFAVACTLQGSAAAQPANNGQGELRKLALVIGNASYKGALPLENPANDAADMCATLRALHFQVICKVDVANKREFKDAIYEFTGKINAQTVALFFYAGHGLQMDGINYLLPTGATLRTKSDIEDESVQINYLMLEMEGRRAALNIFLLDACRNDPFTSPIRGYVPQTGLASQLYMPNNSILAMSTGPGQFALDGTGRNSTFTRNLLKHMPTPRQTIEDMLKNASRGISEEARRLGYKQQPQITTSYSERYCLTGCTDQAASEALLSSKSNEVDSLQRMITQSKAKQVELDEQRNALLKTQQELDKLQQSVDSKQNSAGARKQAEADAINADIELAKAKGEELDAIKAALLKKQEELNKLRKALATQQASVEPPVKEVQTRKIEPPPPPKQPITIVPSF